MPRTKQATSHQPSRRALKPPVVEYKDCYDLVFRGYIEDRNVSRKDDRGIKAFEQVCKSDDMCGVFRSGVVMIDVDDGNNANTLQRILDDCGISYLFANTTRGKHFFFYHGKWTTVLKDRSHITAAVGLEVDYKCYPTDVTPLSKTLESGEVQPRPLLTSSNWTGDLVDLPHFLVPVNATEDFQKLTDCRNETFYIYILKLLRSGLDKEQTKHTIRLINNYVLSKPLGDRELNIILRDESFPTENEIYVYLQPGKKQPNLDYELFANHLLEKYDICKIDNSIYVRDDGLYSILDKRLLDKIIISEIKNTTRTMRQEVNDYINALVRDKQVKKLNSILFQNGVLDLDSNRFRDVLQDDVFFNRIHSNYNPVADTAPVIDKFFNDISCNDDEVKALLLEMIGYTLLRGNKYQVFFWLDGEGSNGKGTLIDLLKFTLGSTNITNLTMKGLNARFGLGSLKNALVNISGDESTSYVEESELLKNLTGGDAVKVESKGVDHTEMIYRGNLIFSGNGIPKFKDTSVGLNRRIITIPMLKNFETDGKDINFKDKLLTKEAAEYLIKLAVESLYKVLNVGFTKSDKAETRKQDFIKDNNPMLQFLDEYEIKSDVDVKEVYLAYRVWCEENGITGIMSNQSFSRSITKQGYERKQKLTRDRKKYYVFNKDTQLKIV